MLRNSAKEPGDFCVHFHSLCKDQESVHHDKQKVVLFSLDGCRNITLEEEGARRWDLDRCWWFCCGFLSVQKAKIVVALQSRGFVTFICFLCFYLHLPFNHKATFQPFAIAKPLLVMFQFLFFLVFCITYKSTINIKKKHIIPDN